MASGSSDDNLTDQVAAALLDVNFLEVHGVLRSMGAERLPPGWQDFSPASKRRILRKILAALSIAQLTELAGDFVEGGDNSADPGGLTTSPGRLPPAWRPAYEIPTDPARKYGLVQATVAPTAEFGASESAQVTSCVDPEASIFVVHGRDTATKSDTQLLVERTTGRSTVVLHEQATGGRTIVEQIELHGASAGFAIVLLTGDDQGGLRGGEMTPRARQNVVLELGYFWGLLGRDKVAVLVEDGVELPSDAGGIHYIAIDAGGGWKTKLVQELRDAGFDVDWTKLRT